MRRNRPAAARRRGSRAFKAGFIAICVMAMSVLGAGVASAAAPTVDCNGVFDGKTPDPIQKTADKASAVPGETVTYTITWHSTGVTIADVTDCFQVDDGSNAALNALVTVSNAENDVTNVGPDGTLQTLTVSVAIPNDPLLIGHTVNDRAKITHGSAESRSDTVGVAIVAPPNVPPTVSCPTMTKDGLSVSYTANASDSDGTITNYHWVFGDGSSTDTAVPTTSHTYAAGGTYDVGVTVTDNDGATASAGPCPVTVTAPPPPPPVVNQPPTVACPTMTADGLKVSYSVVASDSDGSITNYHWVFGDGSTADTTVPTTSHTYAAGGSYGVGITVTDNGGATASAGPCPVTITAPPPPPPPVVNQPPTVACPTMTPDGLDASYNVVASDPDGGIANYHWVFGDGATADTAAATVTHSYAADGTYNVSITVTDNDGGLTATAGPCPLTVAGIVVVVPPPIVTPPTVTPSVSGVVTHVLGERKLPKTGAGVTSLALLGAMLMMAGGVIRFVRPRPLRKVFAGNGSVAAMVEAFGLWLRTNAVPIRSFATVKM